VSNESHLSVVDGQQRLTTVIIILAQLYNACADENETQTQAEIRDLISCQIEGQTHFRLENGSVGEYFHFFTENGRNKIKLEIDTTQDIYKQTVKFNEAYSIIGEALSNRDRTITLDTYKQRLLDCEILLFAQKNPANLQQGSSEEIYIDINEKAQRLDPEDIFKGHCFAICKTFAQQNQVKTFWRSIKKNFFSMDHIFKKADMGIFLHFYLLANEATKSNRKDIKKDLTISGENIITYYYDTPTKVIDLLKAMNQYQTNLKSFTGELNLIDHEFSKIMTATPQDIGNSREQLKEVNTILRNIIACNQNLFKLPLFFLINNNYEKEIANKMTLTQLMSFTYLYYIYMLLFSKIGGSRKREALPNSLIRKLYLDQGYLIQFIREIINYSNGFDLDNKTLDNVDARKQFYNILDFKSTSTNTPSTQDEHLTLKLSLFPDAYNLEHLLINQSKSVIWHSVSYSEQIPVTNTDYTFSANDFNTCESWSNQNNCWANFIWVDEVFNRDELKNNDIINKIKQLRGSTIALDLPTPGSYAKKHCHIEIICQHIMNTNGFGRLLTAYNNDDSRENVLDYYRTFIENYFKEENVDLLRTKFKDGFDEILSSLQSLI